MVHRSLITALRLGDGGLAAHEAESFDQIGMHVGGCADNYRIDIGKVFKDLEAHGPVSGDDGRIADRMHEQSFESWIGALFEDSPPPLERHRDDGTAQTLDGGHLRSRGVVRHDELLPGLPPQRGKGVAELRAAGEELSHTVESWRSVLHGLMAAFLRGEAEIDPLRGTPTCASSYCEFQSLCRVDELERLQRRESYQ